MSGPTFAPYGCYTDLFPTQLSTRTLAAYNVNSAGMTLDWCSFICMDYAYFGVTLGTQCFCGDRLAVAAKLIPSPETKAACNGKCGGDPSQVTCGGPKGVYVFETGFQGPGPAWDPYGCYTDASTSPTVLTTRTMSGAYNASTSMTIESCALFCGGFSYFGLVTGSQCFCGDSLANEAQIIPAPLTDRRCTRACRGDPSQKTCGGPLGMYIYKFSPPAG